MRISILFKTLLLLTFIVFSSCSSSKLSNGVSVHKRSSKKEWSISSSNNSEIAVQFNKTESSKVFIKTINDRLTFAGKLNLKKVDLKKTSLRKKIIKKSMYSELNSIANYSEPRGKCDEIILKNGEELRVKILEINETNIVYKICGYLTGPSHTKSKNDILMVLYSDGTKDIFVSDDKNESKKTSKEEDIPLAYGGMGLIFSSLLPIPFLGLIFGCIGLFNYKKNPDKSTKLARNLCITAIIIGIPIILFTVALILDGGF